jgi:signal transduction histidine kinase
VEFIGVNVRSSLINFGLAILGGAALALVQETNASRVQRGSMDLGGSRARELAELRELDGVIFSDFMRPLVAIQASLAAGFDGGAVRQQVEALVGALDRGRIAVERHHLSDAVPTVPTGAELRAPAFKGTLYVVCLIEVVAFLRNLVVGVGLRTIGGVLLVFMLVLAQRVRRRAVTRREIGAFFTLLLTAVLLAFLSWGAGIDNPTVCFLPAAVVVVHMTCGFAWVVPFIVPVLVFLAPWALQQGPAGAEGLTDLLLALALTMATCFLYWRDLRARLVALDLELVTTVSTLQQRLRLTASFFHDQGNLLMALRYLAGQPHLDAPELAEVREMVDRMRAHLDSVVRIYGNEARGTAAEVRPVAVRDVFEGLTLLYDRRLREKGLTLSLSGRSDAVVVADPAVLLDSILSNLTSNALKFTPRGGAVELSVDEEPGGFVLSILDGGPGFPANLTRALARSERLPSTPGTEGEAGHGYGLLLAADLARRMGGKLTLGAKPGGGGKASVVLAKHAA